MGHAFIRLVGLRKGGRVYEICKQKRYCCQIRRQFNDKENKKAGRGMKEKEGQVALFAKEKGQNKKICANIDLYSGLIYQMLRIPEDLYTPLFAIARVAGWSAHRMEELMLGNRVIRPAYKNMVVPKEYAPIDERISGFKKSSVYVPLDER